MSNNVKRYKVTCNYVVAPKSYISDVEFVLASDYDVLCQQLERWENRRALIAILCGHETTEPLFNIIDPAECVRETVTNLKAQLEQAQARVREVEEVPHKYDCSITYRQHEKKWIVRYISWGDDQKMFTGEAENLMEAVNAAKQQIV